MAQGQAWSKAPPNCPQCPHAFRPARRCHGPALGNCCRSSGRGTFSALCAGPAGSARHLLSGSTAAPAGPHCSDGSLAIRTHHGDFSKCFEVHQTPPLWSSQEDRLSSLVTETSSQQERGLEAMLRPGDPLFPDSQPWGPGAARGLCLIIPMKWNLPET